MASARGDERPVGGMADLLIGPGQAHHRASDHLDSGLGPPGSMNRLTHMKTATATLQAGRLAGGGFTWFIIE